MINKISVRSLIGRDLTEKEARTIEWLNSWEEETSKTVAYLIREAYRNGQRKAYNNKSK